MKKICILDYGMGNIRSVAKAFENAGARTLVSGDRKTAGQADAIVLPGVGSFDSAVDNLKKKGLWKALPSLIGEKPFFGVCLGLQILYERSEEGRSRGLGLLDGVVRKFPRSSRLVVPHMGWNTVGPPPGRAAPSVMKGIPNGEYFYFVHSYRAPLPKRGVDGVDGALAADYGGRFLAAVSFGNVFACQFHPEKSGAAGLAVIKNFVDALN